LPAALKPFASLDVHIIHGLPTSVEIMDSDTQDSNSMPRITQSLSLYFILYGAFKTAKKIYAEKHMF
jgi:hypothetical protein